MNTEKIVRLIESLKNELMSLEVFNDSLSVIEQDQKDKKAALILREKELVIGESMVLNKTKELGDKQKTLNTLSSSLSAKRIKLDGEWNRMLIKKEKIEKMSEDVAKDVLKAVNERTKLTTDQVEAQEKEDILSRKQAAMTELNRKLEIKKASVKAAAKRVDEDSAIE